MLQETFNWKSLSLIGGLVLLRFYFQIHAGALKGPHVIEFLQHLQKHVPGKLLILWDGASIHRSKLVREYVASTGGRVEVERLPAYAPELNPVEYLWGHLKTHEIANLVASPSVWNLSFEATAALPLHHNRVLRPSRAMALKPPYYARVNNYETTDFFADTHARRHDITQPRIIKGTRKREWARLLACARDFCG